MLTSSFHPSSGPLSPDRSHERLDSWKEVAQFFRREVRTVQLWEKKESLPIRRHRHSKLGSVFAFRSELEQWWAARSNVACTSTAGVPEGPPLQFPETSGGQSHLARNAYGVGLHFWNQRSRKTLYKSILYLQDAVELDPACASAYATLADAYVSLSYHHLMPPAQAKQRADEAVRRAIVLEPESLQVQNAFINVLLNCRLNRAAAEHECRKLVANHRADARTFELYSIAVGARGQHKQAVDWAMEAEKRAPGSHSALVQLGQACFYAQQFNDARRCMLRAVQMKPQSIMNHVLLGRIEAMLGNWDAVLAAFDQAAILSDNSPLSQALLAYAHAGADDPERANSLLATLEERRHEPCYPAYEIASAHAMLHRDQEALDSLVKACDLGDMKTIFIGQDPSLRRLRPLHGFSRIAVSHRAA